MTTNERLVGAHGTFTVNSTAAVEKPFIAMEVPEDTVIEEIREEGSPTNVVGEYVQVPATAVKANVFITARSGKICSYIKLGSGSVNLVLTEKRA